MKNLHILFLLIPVLVLAACEKNSQEVVNFQVLSIKAGDIKLDAVNQANNINIAANAVFTIRFTALLNTSTVASNIKLNSPTASVECTIEIQDDLRTVVITPKQELAKNTEYTFSFESGLEGTEGETFQNFQVKFKTLQGNISIQNYEINDASYINTAKPQNVELNPILKLNFSAPLNIETINNQTVKLINSFGQIIPLTYSFSNENKTLIIQVNQALTHLSKHYLSIYSDIKGAQGEGFSTTNIQFYTKADLTPKFPVISDEALLTKVQQYTFKYFYDFAHSASGMIRERNSSGDLVTIGGSGFGLMALIVGIERNFITREQGIARFAKIIGYLETADRFHGAWGHWYNGNTGKLIPFSSNDNGGDLVETSFMAQGLMTVRQYLNRSNTAENELYTKIDNLLKTIEWSWYNHDNQNMLSWHWSPTAGWAMNMHIRGYNEALIAYVMAASSTTYGIEPIVYQTGWAGTSYFVNGKTFYGIKLPLGFDYGGPLFFAHYSFLGLDPRKLTDSRANYWEQNRNHTLINREYCIQNPKKFVAYSQDCWGLTASDDNTGYGVHEPTRDIGVISPTAALSSFPYTPDESLKVIKYLYYVLGDRAWGEYGFYDAFNVTEAWWGKSYLAIDQGPIIVMIENQRTGLLWDLFMSADEVKNGLTKLGFSYN